MTKPSLPIECNIATLVPDGVSPSPQLLAEARARAERVSGDLFAKAVAVRELPDGYLVQLGDGPGILALAAEFIEIDRRCCAFLAHRLVVDVGGAPIWLQLTGDHGAKEAIAADLIRLLPDGVRPR